MIKNLTISLFFYVFINNINAETCYAYRSEYENFGDLVYEIDISYEGKHFYTYSIFSEYTNNYYALDPNTGKITIR